MLGRVRTLRPDRLFVLESGLWVLDVLQPVAAVLDPATGEAVRQVSWRELPPAPAGEQWPGPVVLADGASLWTQQAAAGPLVRVGLHGVATATWTDGLLLAACGPAVAWCAPEPPAQELVAGPDPHPVRTLGEDRLLRVAADGTCTAVRTEHPVRSVQPGDRGLLVQVEVDGWTLEHLGAELYEVLRPTRWLLLPWDAPTPDVLTMAEHGLPTDFRAGDRGDRGGHGPFSWYPDPPSPWDLAPDRPAAGLDPDEQGLLLLGLTWRFGWLQPRSGPRREAIATAHTLDGQPAGHWQLGSGTVRAVTALGDRVAIALSRDTGAPVSSPRCAEVLALRPGREEPETLLTGDGVDVTDGCWPVSSRPLDLDSYLAQVLARNSTLETYWHADPDDGEAGEVRPLAEGLSDVRTALVDEWPRTQLEWTFSFARYPGLTLRRRIPLFDELGRADPPQFATIHLVEDLDTMNLPAASEARDGVLDV
jgi:hypothetical protein